MNRKLKRGKLSIKNSPILFEDEEVGTSPSSDEAKLTRSAMVQPNSSLDHSTPISNKFKIDCSNSPDLNYNESPIEPLTQQPQNEVAWDYNRPTKEEEVPVSMEIVKTPKRNILLTKKRNSESPLLYKPVKKKLIHEKQQEHINGFMEELKAIEINITKKKGEKQMEVSDETENEMPVDERSDDSDIKLHVSNDESPGIKKAEVTNKNYDMLDDSIEEKLMLCSQQIEEREFGSNSKNSTNSPNNSSGKMSVDNTSKENVQPVEQSTLDTPSGNTIISKEKSQSLEIPHDSFDDLLVDFNDDDFCINTEIVINSATNLPKTTNKSPIKMTVSSCTITSSKSSTVQNKFFQSKNSIAFPETKLPVKNNNNSYINRSKTSSASVQNKIMNSNASFGYLNNEIVRSNSNSFVQTNHNSNSKNNDVKFFKSKSFSDSTFLSQNNLMNNSGNNTGTSNSLKLNSEPSCYVSGSSTESKSWRRVHSSSSLGSSTNNGRQQSSVNRLTNERTAVEIAKKRQEALMRRNEKLKMKLNNVAVKGTEQPLLPVKR